MQTNIDSLFNKGLILASNKAYDAASQCFEQILHYNPNCMEAILNAGLMHYYAGRYDFAEQFIKVGISKSKGSADAFYYLGLIYQAKNMNDDAISAYQKTLTFDSNYIEAWYNLGVLLFNQEHYTQAIECFKNVISIDSHFEDAYLNLGESYSRMEKYSQAIQCFKRLLSINTANTDALYNMGVAYNGLRQYDKAIKAYNTVLSIDPGHVKSHYNKSFIILALGDFINGFKEYEWRLKKRSTYKSASDKPRWQGKPLPTKTLLVYAEQGFGDCIQFIRFMPTIQQRVKDIVLECQEPLFRLFSALDSVDTIIKRGDELPSHDFQASLLSMGALLNITFNQLPGKVPYLNTEFLLRKELSDLINTDNNIYKVGLVWGGTGSTTRKTDMGRSLSLDACKVLLDIKTIQWFSFQKGARARELDHPTGKQLIDLGQHCLDFADTAMAAKQMDLIITVDTAMAHLAGSLGLNVWTLLSYDADWRWMKGIDYNPWYPSMRVFRQKIPGDWRFVIDTVKHELLHS
ncbi:MAG: TPR repeat-containing protein [Candidatus Magnetoglobus multicellularis str. Araruama]|uniref:TPR repeat-containing protein n=1 Tax=Candidatus Magnetoglobus multicellularis str. Araruama TaxID=890399 RepID=A0A1V1PBR1_9BACT|nr:MAG: TPR repeat-containing protein [Candidatus Magnetoglobus multicellularis str. Araruama]